MRAILNYSRNSSRCAAKPWMAAIVALTLALSASVAGAQKIAVIQTTALGATGGGAEAGSNPVGGTMAVTSGGDAIIGNTYGGQVLLFNRSNGAAPTIVASPSGSHSGAIAVDSQDNLFIGLTYGGGPVVKLPYVNGAYVAYAEPSASTPACTGSDKAECAMKNVTAGSTFPIVSMVFDSNGNLFYGIQNNSSGAGTSGITDPNTIWECNAACLYAAKGTPTKIFQEPAPVAVGTGKAATTAQLTLGGLAVDPWGNVFFTDGAVDSAGNIWFSNLNELPVSGGSYPSTATVLSTNSQASAPGPYVDAITGVTVDSAGTVYFSDLYSGIAAVPNTGAALTSDDVTAGMFLAGTQGFKVLAVTATGDLFGAAYSSAFSGDSMYKTTVNNAWAGSSAVATATSQTNVTLALNDASGCTTAPTVTAMENGTSSSEFSVTLGKCGSAFTGGSTYPVTLNFTPAKAGERMAMLSAADSAKNSGTSTVSGVGNGALVALDPGVWTSFTTGFSSPESISVDGLGNLAIADAGANKVFWIASGTTTLVSIGTGFSNPDATAFDANGNLYIADGNNNQIVEIPNTGGTLNAAAQSVFIADTVTFGGTALNGPSGLAFGPDGVLYISDLKNGRVLTYNPSNGDTAVRVSGLSFPWGLAVDANNTLYVAETGGGKTWVYQDGAAPVSFAPTGITQPWGVAVDGSGSLYISDTASGEIARVPNEGGKLTAADAIVVEGNPKSAYGLALDWAGNLYSTDSAGAAAYAVQRTAGTVAVGPVDDDSTGSASIWVQSAGPAALTLGSPIFTVPTPSTSFFSLAAGSTNGCTSKSGASGTVCDLSATFAPPNDSPAGALAATSTLNSNALNAPAATLSMSGTAVFEDLTAQTITFTPPASPVAYGVKPIALVATGGASGNPVVFSVASGPAIVSGSTLTITGAGTVVVAANQNGNSTYAAAPQVTHNIVVSKAALVIKATNVGVKFGEPLPVFTYTATGFVNGDTKTSLSGKPLETTVAKKGSPVGSYPIVIKAGTLTSAKYTFAFKDGTLTIESLGVTKTPVFKPLPGTFFTTPVTVKITDVTPGAVIYYTTNGHTPTINSAKYKDPIVVKATETIKAIAVAPGHTQSAEATGVFTLKPPTATPSFSLKPGSYATAQHLTLTDTMAGAVIYFTTDGTTPKQVAADKYTAGKKIALAAGTTTTVKAIAVAPNHSASALATGKYTIAK